eukprot:4256645-Pleurochrysis_carterae.AAC.1
MFVPSAECVPFCRICASAPRVCPRASARAQAMMRLGGYLGSDIGSSQKARIEQARRRLAVGLGRDGIGPGGRAPGSGPY